MSVLKCSLLFIYLNVCQCAASSWTVEIPSSVKGLVGSCVVIPCSFNYPPPKTKATQLYGIWTKATGHVVYHPVESKMLPEYRNRTKLLGDVSNKECSLKIDPLQTSDHGPFHFRIEIENYDSFSYRENAVSIETTTEPESIFFSVKEEVVLGETVSAGCSVSHYCPDSPPVFTWSHSGQKQVQQQEFGEGRSKTTATLTFQPNRTDHSKPLQCTVTYRGGKQQNTTKVLTVKYAPEIKSMSSCHLEEGHVTCMCIAQSNPPSAVFLLLSDRVLPNTKIENQGLFTIATLQDDLGSSKFIMCLANNTVGKANLTLLIPTNNLHVYIAITVGVGVAVLVILLIVVGVVKKCSQNRRAVGVPTSIQNKNSDNALEIEQYTVTTRKRKTCDDVQFPGSFSSEHTYGNTMTDWEPDDDATYANV